MLNIEKMSMGNLNPILLELWPLFEGAHNLGGNRWVRGEPFQEQVGLLDTDTIDTPGVGAHLLYSTILSQDKGRYFQNSPQDMEEFESHLAIIRSLIVPFLQTLVWLSNHVIFSFSCSCRVPKV